MTYKNAVGRFASRWRKNVSLSLIRLNQISQNYCALLLEYAQALAGRYWTVIDIGVGPEDADVLAKGSDFIFARASQYEPGFNPSEFTAFGGFMGIKPLQIRSLIEQI